jgi:transcriptional regulator with XRE-family HTH domain
MSSGVNNLFGKNLKFYRNLRKLSLIKLSSYTGLTHNFINDIEQGKKWVSPRSLELIAGALDIDPYQLFLPEDKNGFIEEDMVPLYLEELELSFQKMIGEMKVRYTHKKDKAEETEKDEKNSQ